MKKRNVVLFFAALFLFAGFAGGQEPAGEARAVPVTGGLYLVEGLEGGNVAFLVTDEGVLVIDSGNSPEAGKLVMAEIAKVTDKPVKYLVLTHYHGDHTFGLQAFPAETVIVAQRNTAENMRRLNGPRIQGMLEKGMPEAIAAQKAKVAALAKKKGGDLEKEQERLRTLEGEFAGLKGLRLVYPAMAYDERLSITLGGETVEISHPGPAHTNGDSLVHFPGLKVMHMGDLFFSGSYPYIGAEAGCDTANWIVAIEAAAARDLEKIVPGHGPLSDKAGLLRMAAYLGDLRRAVQEAIAAGKSLEEAKKMAPLPAWKDLKWERLFPQNVEAVYNEMTRKP